MRIAATRAFEQIQGGSIVISDGAKAYPSICAECGLRHESCNHAGGQFVKVVRRGPRPKLNVHTGGIDCVWKRVKEQLPGSIHTLVNKKVNGLLWKRVRQWQWRNANRTKCLLFVTGKALHAAAFN